MNITSLIIGRYAELDFTEDDSGKLAILNSKSALQHRYKTLSNEYANTLLVKWEEAKQILESTRIDEKKEQHEGWFNFSIISYEDDFDTWEGKIRGREWRINIMTR